MGEVFKFDNQYFLRISGRTGAKNVFNLSHNYIDELSFCDKPREYKIIEGAFIEGAQEE